LQAENSRLRNELAEARLEKDIQKKAYLAREPRGGTQWFRIFDRTRVSCRADEPSSLRIEKRLLRLAELQAANLTLTLYELLLTHRIVIVYHQGSSSGDHCFSFLDTFINKSQFSSRKA
jgi:hypothetical protein